MRPRPRPTPDTRQVAVLAPLLRRLALPGATAAVLVALVAAPAFAADERAMQPSAATSLSAAILPDDVADHFESLGVTVDPRQRPAGRAAPSVAEADGAEAGGRLPINVYDRPMSATVARIGLGKTGSVVAWSTNPGGRPNAVDRLTVIAQSGSRATVSLRTSGAVNRIETDIGESIEIGGRGGAGTMTIRFHYGYGHDERVVRLPDWLVDAAEAEEEAADQPAAKADVRQLKLQVKACPNWPQADRIVDAWVDVNPAGKPGTPSPTWFPLDRRSGKIDAANLNVTQMRSAKRDVATAAGSVQAAVAEACATFGTVGTRDICALFTGDSNAVTACRRIVEPYAKVLCPAVRASSGWGTAVSKLDPKTFAKRMEVRFNVRFQSPYGTSWVSSSPVKKVRASNRSIGGTVALPCWDVYEAPFKMTGSYQWPACFSPYAEAKSTLQFANYMKGWYAWAALSNWTLTVYQTADCLSSNYVEGPFTPAGTAKLNGNYAKWVFDNARYGGPDHFTGHINFDGKKIWGNVEDKRYWRRTSAKATLYGTFSGKRAR